jgi:hypothetical protein
MTSKKVALLVVALISCTSLSALAQGNGGGAASGVAGSGTGGTNQTPAVSQSQANTNKIVADEQSAAVKGTKTAPASVDSGVVSAPGVGVGHAANGQPIGTPGSGLGSPEDSVGSTK